MQKRVVRGLLAGLAVVFAVTMTPVAVSAHEGHSHDDESTATTVSAEDRGSELKDRLKQLHEDRKQQRTQRLEAAKLRVCEARKNNITAIMKRASTRAENHIKVFDAITTRVKNFYQTKGKMLANYDELVAAVESAKAKAQEDAATLKTLETIDCSGEDPKGSVEAYKTALKTVNEDLKAYRTAVKNLIVGVKSVQEEN